MFSDSQDDVLIPVFEDEYRSNPYLRNCTVYDRKQSYTSTSYEYIMSFREVQEARRLQAMYGYQNGCMGMISTQGVYPMYQTVSTSYGSGSCAGEKPKEKEKIEKVSKQIRHQYLRRIIEARNKHD